MTTTTAPLSRVRNAAVVIVVCGEPAEPIMVLFTMDCMMRLAGMVTQQ